MIISSSTSMFPASSKYSLVFFSLHHPTNWLFLFLFVVTNSTLLFSSTTRLPTSMSSHSGTEFGRITFEFETVCAADCELYFMMVRKCPEKCYLLHTHQYYSEDVNEVNMFFQDVNRKSTTVVESWERTKTRQTYTHVMTKNASVSYTWAFQRTNQPSDVSIS